MERIHRLVSNEYAECYQADHQTENEQLFRLFTDYLYAAPLIKVADHFSKSHRIYIYQLSKTPEKLMVKRPSYITNSKNDLNAYIFEADTNRNPEEQLFASALKTAWRNFTYNQDPNSILRNGGITWQPYERSQRRYLNLNLPLDKRREMSFPRSRQMIFWNEYLPRVIESEQCSQYQTYDCADFIIISRF